MNVVARATQVTFEPQKLSFTFRQGDKMPPSPQNIAVASNPVGAKFSGSVSSGAGNWLEVSPANGTAPGSMTVSVNPASLASVSPGTYEGKIRVSADTVNFVEEPVTLTVIPADAPYINPGGVAPVYGVSTSVQPGSWISIYGSNLASTTESWNGDFPTSLGGLSVTVNGKPGYLWFVSPSQINLQAPEDAATGRVSVVVTNGHGSVTSTVSLREASPSFSLLDRNHVAGVILTQDGAGAYGNGAYDLLGPVGAFSYNTRPVKEGETLSLFGVGFGPTNPHVSAGQPFTGSAPTVNPVSVVIGGIPASVSFSGLVGAGMYQINVTVPRTPPGEQVVQATVNGVQTPIGPVVTVR